MDGGLKRLHLIDWDFPLRSSQVSVHDICWYPARFVPAIPSHLIEALTEPGQTVCDPFCGSGTTLVEALLLNRHAYGLDVNPYAILIAETKCLLATRPHILKRPVIDAVLHEVAGLMVDAQWGPNELSKRGRGASRGRSAVTRKYLQTDLFDVTPPLAQADGDRNRLAARLEPLQSQRGAWYHPETLGQLCTLFDLIEGLDDEEIRQTLETLFIATLMPASGHKAKKPYGYFADNVVPKEKLYRNAYALFHARLQRLVGRLTHLIRDTSLTDDVSYVLRCANSTDSDVWRGISYDCVITSPPYPGAVDYCTAFRLASLWFPEYGSVDYLRQSEIGARWMRRRPSSRDSYFALMRAVFGNVSRHLREGGIVAIVLPKGRSHSPTIHRLLREIAEADGLEECARMERAISRRYFVRKDGGIHSEIVIVLRKSSR